MVLKGRKAVALAAMITVVGTMLLTSTTPVVAGTYTAQNVQPMKFHPRPNDFLANLAGAAVGGALANTAAIAGAIGGSAVAGGVGAVVGILVASCPQAYSFATFTADMGYSSFLLSSSAPPILNDYMVAAQVPSTALDS